MSDHGLHRDTRRGTWVAYSGQTGNVLGEVRQIGTLYQVYIATGYAKEGTMPQGSPHRTLEAASRDLFAFYR